VHKFQEQVRGLLRRHLQQLLLDRKGVQLDHGKPKQMQHLHARGRMYENGLDQLQPKSDEDVEAKLKGFANICPQAPYSRSMMSVVADMLRDQILQSSPHFTADEVVFEAAWRRAFARYTKLQRCVSCLPYEWTSGLLIVANVVFIVIQTELKAQQSVDVASERTPLP